MVAEQTQGRHLIVGTAGHIDHGKTALVRALTGKNTDRLREEQERGISIDIDFAPLRLDDETLIGLVDVPGHERFIRNMVAGAAGIDAALLVVDVMEGMKPQTKEHLDILELLGVQKGIVAITKTDLADAEWTEMALEVVRDGLQGTVLADAPLIPVSSYTGVGMDVLRAALQALADEVHTRDVGGAFRLPVDKVFSIPGFGTVVSGTVWRGGVSVGDALEVLPGRIPVRVRGIQSHGEAVTSIAAGRRAALNLTGIHHDALHRGMVVAASTSLTETVLMDVQLQAVGDDNISIRHRTSVRVHLGTAEVVGRLLLLEADELRGGESAYAQLELAAPLVCQHGDKFVIRRLSPVQTIGGGTVLDAVSPKLWRRKREQTLSHLAALDKAGPQQRLMQRLAHQGVASAKDLAGDAGMTTEEVAEFLAMAEADGQVIVLPGGYASAEVVESWFDLVTDALRRLHQRQRFVSWVARADVTSAVEHQSSQSQVLPARALTWLLQTGESHGYWRLAGTKMQWCGWQVRLAPEESDLLERLLTMLQNSGWTALEASTLTQAFPGRDRVAAGLLDYAAETHRAHAVAPGLWMHDNILQTGVAALHNHFGHQPFTLAEARDLWQTSRKPAVLLLEYLDERCITERSEDRRTLTTDFAEKLHAVTDF